jgi:hypothetical protein
VTTLAVSANERTVFASGFDHKIVMLQRVQDMADVSSSGNSPHSALKEYGTTDPTDGEWVYAYSHRPHTHDVRALECGVVHTAAVGGRGSGSRNNGKMDTNHNNEREMVLSGGVVVVSNFCLNLEKQFV